jgi:DNA-binding response OmpR family regulator
MRGKRILVVEDEYLILSDIERSLIEEGMMVVGVSTGEDALEYARKERYDCIVLDLGLPTMTGVEVLIHLQRVGCPSPVVVMSGHADAHTKSIIFEKGARCFFEKPVQMDQLIAGVKEAIDSVAVGPFGYLKYLARSDIILA